MKTDVKKLSLAIGLTVVAAGVAMYMFFFRSDAAAYTYNVLPDGTQLFYWTAPAAGYYTFGVYGAAAMTNRSETTDKGTSGGNGGGVQVNQFVNQGDQITFYCGKKGNGGATSDEQYKGGEYSWVSVNGAQLAIAGGGGGAGKSTDGHDGGEYILPGAAYDVGKYHESWEGESSRGDGTGSSGGSGAHGGNAGENTLHEHTDACYADEWEETTGGYLWYHDSQRPNSAGQLFSEHPAVVYEQGNWIDVSDYRELEIELQTLGGSSWGSWAYALMDESQLQRFWLEDQDGTIIWEIPNFVQYFFSHGGALRTADWNNFYVPPSTDRPTESDNQSAWSDALDRAVEAAKAQNPNMWAASVADFHYMSWYWNFDIWDYEERDDANASALLLYCLFNIDLPEGTTKVKLHYYLNMTCWWDDPNAVMSSGVWSSMVLCPPMHKKKVCEYSHEPGGTMGENQGAYGGTSTTNSGYYVGGTAGANSGDGFVVMEELPVDLTVYFSNIGSDGGTMADMNVNGNLSEQSFNLPPNQYTKKGSTFLGWSYTQGGGVDLTDQQLLEPGKNPCAGHLQYTDWGKASLVLYPVFDVNTYRLYFNVGDPRNSEGVSVANRIPGLFAGYQFDGTRYYKEVEYGSQIGTLPDPRLIGWDFSGWYLESKRKITSTDV